MKKIFVVLGLLALTIMGCSDEQPQKKYEPLSLEDKEQLFHYGQDTFLTEYADTLVDGVSCSGGNISYTKGVPGATKHWVTQGDPADLYKVIGLEKGDSLFVLKEGDPLKRASGDKVVRKTRNHHTTTKRSDGPDWSSLLWLVWLGLWGLGFIVLIAILYGIFDFFRNLWEGRRRQPSPTPAPVATPQAVHTAAQAPVPTPTVTNGGGGMAGDVMVSPNGPMVRRTVTIVEQYYQQR